MNTEQIRALCLSWNCMTEDVKWEVDRTFCVHDKMFVVLYHTDEQPWLTVKVSQEDFETMIQSPGIKPAPYLARYHWGLIEDRSKIPEAELQELIEDSYVLVAQKMTKKKRKECSFTDRLL